MLSVCSITGSCLEKVRSHQSHTSFIRIRPSSLLQIFTVLSFLLTLFIGHVYYSNHFQNELQTFNDGQSIRGVDSLSCKHPSANYLKYVAYNETELVDKALSIMKKTMWMYVKPTMTSDERLTVHELLKEFVKICDLFNITDYFLFSGSLLGSYRHHGLQPWDDDIDILMKYSDQVRIIDAFEKYSNQSKEVDATFTYTRLKFFHRSRSVAIRPYAYRWPFLDLSFYHENETHIWEVAVYGKRKYHIVEKSLIFPLHLRPFEALMISSPKDAYTVLKLLFRDPGCVPLTWIHRKERRSPPNTTRFECDRVAPIYPFVHRRAGDSCIEESLWVNDTLLYTVLIEEPTYAVAEPYTLKLITPDSLNISVI